MKTEHRALQADARRMRALADESVQLVVTSPPYPMIAMWDACFQGMDGQVGRLLEAGKGWQAFERMHRALDMVWAECHRLLTPGGLVCINIGDATRSLDGEFQLFTNHARIVSAMLALGFMPLPDILWRKPTNAPNKFMGSGMLPAGAYVTYEHEYVLIFRKGGKRVFRSAEDKLLRRRSAYFWEERNLWFSDVWFDLRGTRQKLRKDQARLRSAAYPPELAYRLICMYSIYGDTVLDPFLGTGTTLAAAVAGGRNSVGCEQEPELQPVIAATAQAAVAQGNARIDQRLASHQAFVAERQRAGKPIKHENAAHGFPVITGQERDLELLRPRELRELQPGRWQVEHGPEAPPADVGGQVGLFG